MKLDCQLRCLLPVIVETKISKTFIHLHQVSTYPYILLLEPVKGGKLPVSFVGALSKVIASESVSVVGICAYDLAGELSEAAHIV